MKTCSACHESRPIAQFGKCGRNKDGLNSRCRECMAAYYEKSKVLHNTPANVARRAEYFKAYHAERSESRNAYAREYRKLHPDVSRKWYKDNREHILEQTRARQYYRKYGLSMDEYEGLTKEGCMLCGSLDDLHIDHDHKCCPGQYTCGKCVRGVLCNLHNVGIGMFNDDTEMLKRAIIYLEREL